MLDVQTWNLIGKNHHVIFDNFFSTVKLVEDLLEDGMYSNGDKKGEVIYLGKNLTDCELFRRKGLLLCSLDSWRALLG